MADAVLKIYSGVTEYGTVGNPISFGVVVAGSIVDHSLNPLYLWNDKGGGVGSVPAKLVTVQVLAMWLVDEVMGTSNGNPNQTFTCDVIPVIDNVDPTEIIVTVGTVIWERVPTLVGESSTSEIYTFNPTTGVVTFGDNATGKIPTNGLSIKITYMPDTLEYGKEPFEETWLEIKSFGATSTVISIVSEQQISTDSTHVTIANPVIQAVRKSVV